LVGLITARDLQFSGSDEDYVESIMAPIEKLFLADPSMSRETMIEKMLEHKVEKLPIVDKNRVLVGMITLKDSLRSKKFPNSCRDTNGSLIVGAAVGVGVAGFERVEALVDAGVDVIVIDTAHGHSLGVLRAVSNIKSRYQDLQIIAGNVVTSSAAYDLSRAGVDGIKVGIGPGSICTTRIVSGAGMPQLTAIIDVASKASVPVICDGGIRYSGDITKAIIAGADAVMIGGLFAGTDESPGEVDLYQGRSYKSYRGMGSLSAMQQVNGSKDRYFQDGVETNKLVPEGIEGRVPCRGPVANVIHQLIGGLRAGMGYSGTGDIEELKTDGKLIQITNAGSRESHVHDVQIVKESPNYSFGDR
jgi:IMP dehydrogenase